MSLIERLQRAQKALFEKFRILFLRIRNPKDIETTFSRVETPKEIQAQIQKIVQEVLESYKPEIFFKRRRGYKYKILEASFLYLHTKIRYRFFFEEGENLFEKKISDAWSINIKVGIGHDGNYNTFKYPLLRSFGQKLRGVETEYKVYEVLTELSKRTKYTFTFCNDLDNLGIDFLVYEKGNYKQTFLGLQIKNTNDFSEEKERLKQRNEKNRFYNVYKNTIIKIVVVPRKFGFNETRKKIERVISEFENNTKVV